MPPALVAAVMPRIPLGQGNLTRISLNLYAISSADDLWLGLGEWNTRMSKFEQYRRNAEEANVKRTKLRATKSELHGYS